MSAGLDLVFLGLSITSAWGNGHATTYRALLRELVRRGHRVLFLERDAPWYADNRDLPRPGFCELGIYGDLEELRDVWGPRVRAADAVVVGSYVPDGASVATWVVSVARGATAFYDIDTPVTVRDLADGRCAYLTADLVPRFGLYLSFTGGPMLARLERDFRAKRARALYCSVDPDAHFPEHAEPRWDLGYLGTFSEDRQRMLDELLVAPARSWARGRFVVAGAQYPRSLVWPRNVERIEHLPPARHRRFYCQQRFTLNVTRTEMVRAGWSPSVRIFEAAACATAIVSDPWPGIEQFLAPGHEILLARSVQESLELLRSTPERERVAVGQRARRRVLAEHTAACRAELLEREITEALDRSASGRSRIERGIAVEGS